MDRAFKIFLAMLVGVIILIILLDGMRTKPVNWQPTYSLDTKNPLDLYVFNQNIDELFPNSKLERSENTFYQYTWEHGDTLRNYLIIKNSVYQELDTLMLKSVKNGSNLFVNAEFIDSDFLDSLNASTTDLDYMSPLTNTDSVELNLTMSNWNNTFYKLKSHFTSYFYVDLDKTTTTILGEMKFSNGDVFPSFIKIKYGKGTIFLHNQSVVFTNYALLHKESSASYVAHLLSYLPKNLPTVWLVENQTKHSVKESQRTPLSVVFKYPALRATWLIFLYGLLLYVLFNAKRRQRIVPIIKPLKNTTVEFTQTIGNLYLQELNATSITAKKIIYFLDKIRTRYYLDTKTLDEEFVKRLHAKSGKDIQLIKEIVHKINKFNKNKYAEQEHLIQFNELMEKFWEE